MSSGNFQQLKQSIEAIDKLLSNTTHLDTEDEELLPAACSKSISEDWVIEHHGKALRQVSKIRDTYSTQACDLCEQLKSNLVCLSVLEGRRGFDSVQFQSAKELLYQEKTKHEDVDKFKETTFICKYCADKLRSGKEVARNVFNCLSVMPVPAYLSKLNIFERVGY